MPDDNGDYPIETPMELRILFLLDEAIRSHLLAYGRPAWLRKRTCDNDDKDGEIIFTLADGRNFVLRSGAIVEGAE